MTPTPIGEHHGVFLQWAVLCMVHGPLTLTVLSLHAASASIMNVGACFFHMACWIYAYGPNMQVPPACRALHARGICMHVARGR